MIQGLQERIQIIKFDIAQQESIIIAVQKEIADHEEDLQFHLHLLEELGGNQEESSSDESIKIVDEAETPAAIIVETRLADSVRSPQTLTRAQFQEQKEWARAWDLDRQRERERCEQKRPGFRK